MTKQIFVNKKLLAIANEKSIRTAWEIAGHFRKNHVADLSLGNPEDPPPKKIFTEISKLIKTSKTSGFFAYMDNAGFEECRKAVAHELIYKKYMPESINQNYIIMTCGASGAANCALKAILNPSEKVIIISPHFVDFPKYVQNHQGKPIFTSASPPDFDLNIENIEKKISSKTKAIIINSPNNPTGTIYSKEKLTLLSKLLTKKSKEIGHPIYLISDEVYREIIYPPNKFYSPCSFYPNSIMIYSFSKSLNLAGERIGYAAVNPKAVEAERISKLIKLSNRILGYTNAPSLIQKILPKLLPIRFNIKSYNQRKEILSDSLKKAGFEFHEPQGSFYFFIKIPANEKKFQKLANKEGLFFVSSKPFGIEGYIRLAFCNNKQTIEKACEKILRIKQML